MEIPSELEGILVSTPDTLCGAVRFARTRVLVQSLLDAIYCGQTLDYFLRGFPNVTREQAEAVLRWEQNQARKSLGLESLT